MLEVARAVADKDWLLAVELRRRMVLWSGPGTAQEQDRDAREITFPAALQAVQETYRTLTGVTGLRLEGFHTRGVHDFFREHAPDIPLLDGPASDGRAVVLRKHGAPDESGYAFALDTLVDMYRINTRPIDVSQL